MSARSQTDDADLVRRAKAGDREAFGVLVGRYMKAAYSVALAVIGRHEDAEDAAQESFLVALQHIEECRNPERFGAWLLTTVRNRAKNLLRRESIRASDPIPLDARSSGPLPDRDAESEEVLQSLKQALSGLPQVQREVVLLHDLQGWKHREIAERLGLPEGTVRSHLHFARKALRTALAGPHSEDRAGDQGRRQ
jgi:RNA polymerase sigma-70 factor (ECF subfamily)